MLPISLRVKSKVLSMVHKPFPGLQAPHLLEFIYYQFSPSSLCHCHTALLPFLRTNHLHSHFWVFAFITPSVWMVLPSNSLLVLLSIPTSLHTNVPISERFFLFYKINPSHIALLFSASNII